MKKKFLKIDKATILTCAGGVGLVVTSILTAKATLKVTDLLEEAKNEKGDELTKTEVIIAAAPVYLPAVMIGTGTMMCIFGANTLNKRKQASLMSAYSLLVQSYKQYKRKLKDLYGEEAHENILDAIAVEKADDVNMIAPVCAEQCQLYSDKHRREKMLFYDEFGKRFFETTLEQVISAEYHLNRNYVMRGDASLNELYDFLGLGPTDYGNEVGWVIDDGCCWIDFNNRFTTVDGRECYVVEAEFPPTVEWQNYL